ncbi:hypothetical protein C8R45DRAFT_932919 [Mycena sanguinolenta]|nr:hypothetical protein C8R45DRAFT_932919 [Mycena sanguinolenta]
MSENRAKCVHTNPVYKAEKAEEHSDLECTSSSVQPRACGLKRVASSVVASSAATLRRGDETLALRLMGEIRAEWSSLKVKNTQHTQRSLFAEHKALIKKFVLT